MSGSIFVVDDNPNNLSLLAGILRGAAYEVRLANSGKRALAAIRTDLPELILLDVNMPDMNGLELCRALKADPRTAEVPVIFLSALDDVEDKVNAFSAGGVDYVTKPFHGEEVLARVATQLRLSRLRRALEAKNEELRRKNEQLEQAWRSNDRVFTALSDVLAGTVFAGRYRLEAKIGMGGFAAIYRGTRIEDGQRVAIKVLRPDGGRDPETYLARFKNEGASGMRLSHESAVKVHETGLTAAGVGFLVMELLEGRTLADEIAAAGPLPLPRCLSIIAPVCEVLAHAHGLGVLHRDIKPANIFLHAGAGGEVVKVVDFGIAKLFEEDQSPSEAFTTVGRLLGTPVYMSPERLLGKAHDTSSDSYSVGVTLYQMISGRLPFDVGQGNLGSVVMTCLTEPPTPLGRVATVPAAVELVVMRAMAKSPDDRPSVSELARGFAAALGGVPAGLGLTVEIR